jgi:hypothetical protein
MKMTQITRLKSFGDHENISITAEVDDSDIGAIEQLECHLDACIDQIERRRERIIKEEREATARAHPVNEDELPLF